MRGKGGGRENCYRSSHQGLFQQDTVCGLWTPIQTNQEQRDTFEITGKSKLDQVLEDIK